MFQKDSNCTSLSKRKVKEIQLSLVEYQHFLMLGFGSEPQAWIIKSRI